MEYFLQAFQGPARRRPSLGTKWLFSISLIPAFRLSNHLHAPPEHTHLIHLLRSTTDLLPSMPTDTNWAVLGHKPPRGTDDELLLAWYEAHKDTTRHRKRCLSPELSDFVTQD